MNERKRRKEEIGLLMLNEFGKILMVTRLRVKDVFTKFKK